jgi:hypothetical protein
MTATSETPTMFSRDDLSKIRRSLNSKQEALTCPRCGTTLQVQGGMAGSGYRMLHVRCRPCYRVAFIGELPGERWNRP